MTALTLYELASEFRTLAGQLAAIETDEQTIADTLEGERFPVEQKALAVAAVIGNLQAEADAYKAHADKVAERAKAIAKRVDWLKRYLLTNMDACGISELQGGAIKIKLKANPPCVEVFEPALLPQAFMRTPEPPPPSPDKKAIAESIKKGMDVPGARLTHSKRVEII